LIKETSHTGDYDFYETATDILSKSHFKKWRMIYTNFKEAALQAGLGVKAKNSLLYSYRFGFDCKICVIGFDEMITDIPTNRRVNKKLWNRCVGCWDCAVNCPVKAIHNDGNKMENNWIDSAACDDFLGLSDHSKIPSIKKFWHEKVHPELSKKEVTKLNTFDKVKKKYGKPYGLPFDKNGYTIDPSLGVKKDNKPIPVPMCRECTSQPRCSKWGGKFPYQMEMK
jgi:Pyruvate/2-oxoacid:ferredoxin oxidoreductase delta subunit